MTIYKHQAIKYPEHRTRMPILKIVSSKLNEKPLPRVKKRAFTQFKIFILRLQACYHYR